MTTEQGGNQPEIIQPYPSIQLTDASRSWLAGINSGLASGGELTTGDMKALLLFRHALNIPDPRRALLRKELGEYYGLPSLQSSNDVRGELSRYDDDIAAAIDLESYAIDPLQALDEYQTVNWGQELEPYMGSATRGLAISFRFSQFVAEIKSAIVYGAIGNMRARLNAEADRILTMSPDEWNEYRGGVRYAQGPYAEELRQNGSAHCDSLEGVTRTHMWGPSSKEQWKGLHRRFGQSDTYKVMKDRAIVTLPRYNPTQMSTLTFERQRELRLEDIIIPRF